MSMIDRVKGILLEPKTEWPKIAAEPATAQSLYTGWIMILAAIGPIALLLRSIGGGAVVAIVSYVIALVVVYVVALIADALSPSFDGEKGLDQALKLVAYSMTPGWVGAIFQLLPWVGGLLSLLASLYGIYLFYLGAPALRKCSDAKAIGYTIVVVLCVIVLQVLLASVLFAMLFGSAMMTGSMFR